MYKSVMIIDDNSIDLYIAEIVLKKNNFAHQVILKDSAVLALQYLAECAANPENLPELIFLDINMPEVNGFDFLEAFGKLPEEIIPGCDIIMLSSSLDPYDHQRVEENRFVSRFINKPLRKDKLEEILNDKRKSIFLESKV